MESVESRKKGRRGFECRHTVTRPSGVSLGPLWQSFSLSILSVQLIDPQNTGPKYLIIKTRKRASKAEYSKRLEQYEMDFTAQIFQVQDIDSLLAGASDGGDA